METLKAIDTVVKLIPFLKSLNGERRQSFFDRIIKPLYTNVSAVQDFYLQIIGNLRKTALDLNIEEQANWTDKEVTYENAVQQLENEKSAFCYARESSITLRSTFRVEAKQIFNEIKWKEEKEFLLLVMFYFNGEAHKKLPDEILELYIQGQFESIEESNLGAISAWDTPSTIIAHRIAKVSSSDKLVRMLDEHRDKLILAFGNATLGFKKIERKIVRTT